MNSSCGGGKRERESQAGGFEVRAGLVIVVASRWRVSVGTDTVLQYTRCKTEGRLRS